MRNDSLPVGGGHLLNIGMCYTLEGYKAVLENLVRDSRAPREVIDSTLRILGEAIRAPRGCRVRFEDIDRQSWKPHFIEIPPVV